jgi:hypothetical protein
LSVSKILSRCDKGFSLVDSLVFSPFTTFSLISVLAGIIILTLLYLFFRKKLIKPYDESEEQFYLAD